MEYQVNGGTWLPWLAATTQTSAQFTAPSDGIYTFRVNATDQVDNTSAWTVSSPVLVDTTPPVVTITAPAQAGLLFTVAWYGTDAGAGVAHYDVEYKDSSGSWQPWFTDTSATSGQFVGAEGHTYTFRARATDILGNTSGWVTSQTVQIETVTKYYVFGSQRVAMRVGNAVYYLHGDHLGSTSLTTNASGGLVSQARYTPFGELGFFSQGGNSSDVNCYGFKSKNLTSDGVRFL